MITTVKTANNGGCGECACHCHSDDDVIPAGHIATCKFADDDYVPPDFQDLATEAAKGVQHGINEFWRNNSKGPS